MAEETHGADAQAPLAGMPSINQDIGDAAMAPEWWAEWWQPPSHSFAQVDQEGQARRAWEMERDRELEARELLYEQRTLQIQAARALMAVQVLDGHNRLLRLLLVQERRKSGHCPQRTSGHCPHAAPVEPDIFLFPGKY